MKGIRLNKSGTYYKYTLKILSCIEIYWGRTEKSKANPHSTGKDIVAMFRNSRKNLMRVNLTKQQLYIGSLVIFTIIMAIIELS